MARGKPAAGTTEATRPEAGRSPLARVGRALALATSLGSAFAILVSFGALAGLTADKKLGTGPWLMLAGLLLGCVSAFVSVFRVVAFFGRLESRSDDSPGITNGDTRPR